MYGEDHVKVKFLHTRSFYQLLGYELVYGGW